MVMTYRNDELHRRHSLLPFIGALRRAIRPEEIELSPFTRSEVESFIEAARHSSPDQAFISELYKRSGGNAFFVEELLAVGRSVRLPAMLREVILTRIVGLDENTVNVARAIAAAGSLIEDRVLARACDLGESELAAAIEETIRAGLCIRDDAGVRFRHELSREAVETDLLAGDRAGLHSALAFALVELAPDRKGEIARHFYLSGDQPRAFEASIAAGRAAAANGADAEALLQFERALELWRHVPDAVTRADRDHYLLILDAADAAGRAGSFARANALGQRAMQELASHPRREQGVASLRLVEWAWFAPEGGHTEWLIAKALECIPPNPPTADRALALAWHAQTLFSAGEYDPAAAAAASVCAEEALELAQHCDARPAEALAMLTIGSCACNNLNPVGLESIRESLQLALRLGLAHDAGRAYDHLAVYLAVFGRHDEVIGLEQEALDFCAATGLQRVDGLMIELRVIRSLRRLVLQS
jgi:hypothetical protein